MFKQWQLKELFNSNSFIVQNVSESESLIIHEPIRLSWESNDKVIGINTKVFNTYTEFINHIMWTINTMANIEYIDEEEYKNKKFEWSLI